MGFDRSDYLEKDGKLICKDCGQERRFGDWPWCGPTGHTSGSYGNNPFPEYVDEHLLPDTDHRAQEIGLNGAGEPVRGVRISSRDQRRRLMREQGVDWHGRKYGRSKNPEY